MIKLIKNTALLILIKVLVLFAKRAEDNKGHILILSNTAMGDTLWITAALQYLYEHSPDTDVTVLTSEVGRQVLANNPYIDEIWVDQKSLKDKIKILISILRTPFSATFNFHTSKRFISYIGYLGSPGRYYGIHPECKAKEMLDGGINSPEFETLHKIQARILLLARYLNLVLPLHQNQYCLSVYPSPTDREKAKTLLNYDSNKKYVFIQPGASIKIKQWHPDFFKKVVSWLDQEDIVCVFAGNQKEKELIESVSAGGINTVKLGYSNTVMELASVIDLCSLIITNDTGPMHIAEALNKPMICFFWDNHVVPAKPITSSWLKIYESKRSSNYILQPNPEKVILEIESFLYREL